MESRKSILSAFVACLVFVVSAQGGDIDPPMGPVGPTMKTLIDVEPRTAINDANTPGEGNSMFRITEPGSYFLANNIVGETAKHGIEVLADDVTLDLNGFALIGVAGSLNGILVQNSPAPNSVIVTNGSVSNWGGIGVYHVSIGGNVTKIRAHHNQASGIHANSYTIIQDCTAQENGSHGIVGAHGGLVLNCIARKNEGHGISGGSDFTVLNCIAAFNGGDGIFLNPGTADGESSVQVVNCTTSDNGGIGVHVTANGVVADCVANTNDSGGIEAANSLVRGNCAVDNTGFDINCLDGSTCMDNHTP